MEDTYGGNDTFLNLTLESLIGLTQVRALLTKLSNLLALFREGE